MPLDNRVLQLSCPANGGISREVIFDRCNGRFLDVLRRREMRLSHRPIDNIHAGLPQLVGLGHSGHGSRGFNAVDAFCQL